MGHQMSHTTKRVPVNGARLRAARLDLGLGTREFGRAAGVSFVLIDSMEKENFVSTTTTVAELRSIAHAAGLSLADVLDAPEPRPICESGSPDDIKTLAAILITDSRMFSNDDIALTLGWTLRHLHAVAWSLDQVLEQLGLRVHRNAGVMCLRPRTTQALEDVTEVERRRAGRDGMIATEATFLWQALNGSLPDKQGEGDRPALGHLVNLGFLRPGARKEQFHVPSDEARFAFEVGN